MRAFALGKRSLRNLIGVHPDLVLLAHRVIKRTSVDYCILDGGGRRSIAQANAYAAAGTGVKKSRHLTGDAIDFVVWKNGKPTWAREDLPDYRTLLEIILEEADDMGLLVVIGVDWNCNGLWGEPGTKEYDWPHVQRAYPWQEKKAKAAKQRRELARINEDAPDTDRGICPTCGQEVKNVS